MVAALTNSLLPSYLPLRAQLWHDCPPETHAREVESILADPARNVILVAPDPVDASRLIGFVEASLRDHAEGCETSPVGYIEGWWVDPAFRRTGVGRALVDAAEAWARSRGCREMASDTETLNALSQRAHGALGYEEVERVVLYRKRL